MAQYDQDMAAAIHNSLNPVWRDDDDDTQLAFALNQSLAFQTPRERKYESKYSKPNTGPEQPACVLDKGSDDLSRDHYKMLLKTAFHNLSDNGMIASEQILRDRDAEYQVLKRAYQKALEESHKNPGSHTEYILADAFCELVGHCNKKLYRDMAEAMTYKIRPEFFPTLHDWMIKFISEM